MDASLPKGLYLEHGNETSVYPEEDTKAWRIL
jgi:hypothetical protein